MKFVRSLDPLYDQVDVVLINCLQHESQTTIAFLIKALSNLYEQLSIANKVHFMKKLFLLCMPENGSFKVHLNKFNEVMNQLRSKDVKLDEKVQALPLLG